MDLLITYAHRSELEVIIVLSLISNLANDHSVGYDIF
jgi:hypothetical protein